MTSLYDIQSNNEEILASMHRSEAMLGELLHELTRLRAIEAAAREVVECDIPSPTQHGGSLEEMVFALNESFEKLRKALANPPGG